MQSKLLFSAPTIRSRALALSSALPHAGDWLNGVPSPALSLHLLDREFRCCLRYWLGIPLYNSQYRCPECSGQADKFGDHQVGCGGNSDRISRHNGIRDALFEAAQSAALSPTREAPGLIADSRSRPADILLPTWHRGRPAALDVHVISPLQSLTLHEAATTPGHALNIGVQRKIRAHLPDCRAAGVDFIPIVVETLGGLADDTTTTIREIGRAISQRFGTDSVTTSQLFHRVAIVLWRGNARLWLHRFPSLPPSIDGLI